MGDVGAFTIFSPDCLFMGDGEKVGFVFFVYGTCYMNYAFRRRVIGVRNDKGSIFSVRLPVSQFLQGGLRLLWVQLGGTTAVFSAGGARDYLLWWCCVAFRVGGRCFFGCSSCYQYCWTLAVFLTFDVLGERE